MTHWLAYALVALAAGLNAVMDRVENENFSSSIFRSLNPKWWYKRESDDHVKLVMGYRPDCWHISKSLMIICWAFALAFPPPHPWWVVVGGCGVAWNLTFNVCYNKLFAK